MAKNKNAEIWQIKRCEIRHVFHKDFLERHKRVAKFLLLFVFCYAKQFAKQESAIIPRALLQQTVFLANLLYQKSKFNSRNFINYLISVLI